jgi:hypothetical protein
MAFPWPRLAGLARSDLGGRAVPDATRVNLQSEERGYASSPRGALGRDCAATAKARKQDGGHVLAKSERQGSQICEARFPC